MDYIKEGKKPPKSKCFLSTPENMAARLKELIGKEFNLTRKPRTDGSNFRKLVMKHLLTTYMPEEAQEYKILPQKKKGVPSFLREYADTYIVTSGDTYNLQVWNRNPNSASTQVELPGGEVLMARDVRFILGKISSDNKIESIIIMTPQYIEEQFGKFGKPTIKQQLIISNEKRKEIVNRGALIVEDHSLQHKLIDIECRKISKDVSIKDPPDKVLPLSYIGGQLADKLLGKNLDVELSTKQRGQQLERLTAHSLGYTNLKESLDGGYPDIRNQMLEVKVQDSSTIDLGKFSPQFEERISGDFTTRTIRYLIALTDKKSGSIDGLILCPGEDLGQYFTYVSDKNFKCQKNIPMSFFEKYKGQVVFNPKEESE